MKICIFQTNAKTHSIIRIVEELNALSPQIQINLFNPFSDDVDRLLDEHSNEPYTYVVNRITGIKYNDYDLEVIDRLEELSPLTSLPSTKQSRIFRCKYEQSKFYLQHGLTHPLTISVKDQPSKILAAKNSFLLKPMRSNQGRGISIHGHIRECIENAFDDNFIIQEQIDNHREWRVIAIAGMIVGALEKKDKENIQILNAANSNLSFINTNQLPKEVVSIVQEVLENTGIYYFGIDILQDQQKRYYILELNLCPGFEYFERSSNLNIAKIITSSLISI